jgi:sulfur-oxidizing protein SoxY
MKRRNFMKFGALALVAASMPSAVNAVNFRKTTPKAWEAHNVNDAIKAMFGTSTTIEQGVKIKLPKVAANGGAVPIAFSTKIPAKTVAVFQDVNPEAAVCAYSVGKYDITEYSIKAKMAKSGTVTVVVEGLDGKLYSGKKSLEVALGGCEG